MAAAIRLAVLTVVACVASLSGLVAHAATTTSAPASYNYDNPGRFAQSANSFQLRILSLAGFRGTTLRGDLASFRSGARAGVAAEDGEGLLSRLATEETGAVGPGAGDLAAAQRFARVVKLPPNSPLVLNRNLTVDEFISQFREASIRQEFPGEFLDQTVEQALRSGNSTVRKLLTRGKWTK